MQTKAHLWQWSEAAMHLLHQLWALDSFASLLRPTSEGSQLRYDMGDTAELVRTMGGAEAAQ